MEHTPPPFFKTGPTPLARLLIFSALSVTLLIADARFNYLSPLRQIAGLILYPLQRVAAAPAGITRRIGEYFVTQSSLREDNNRLVEEKLANAPGVQQLKALQAENRHLRALLATRERVNANAKTAEILYAGRDPFSRKVIIDKGLNDDVRGGQAVVDAQGVVGQVTRAYPWLAEVTLLTDKGQAVPVQNVRSGLRGVVFGTGQDGVLDLRFMPVNADVQNGDQLVTSGIDGTYPPGLPVAEVASIDRSATLMFARITCKPVSGVASYPQVLVLGWQRDLPEAPEPAPEQTQKRRKGRKG